MTPGQTYLGIDVGTTSVKVAVIDESGLVIGRASAAYPTTYERDGRVEQEPEDWWTATLAALAEMAAAGPPGLLASVASIGVSSHAPAVVPVSPTGKPLRRALIWMDRRAVAEGAEIAEHFGDDRYRELTGNRADAFFVAPKVRWLARHEPAVLDEAASILQVNGFMAARLTGEHSIDSQHATITGLWSPAGGSWSREVMDFVGLERSLLPEVRPAHEVIGSVTRTAATATGLRAGTPVIAGTVDSVAAMLEAGVLGTAGAVEMAGTSSVIVMPVPRRQAPAEFVQMSSPRADEAIWLAAMVSTGASLRWVASMVTGGRDTSALLKAAAHVAPGAGGVTFWPYMMGERSPIWRPDASGAFTGLRLGTEAADLVRAVLEGSAFALRENLEVAERHGVALRELRTVGGAAASDVWLRIKADITGIPFVRMRSRGGSAFGTAALAATARGADLATLVASHARVDRVVEPDPVTRDAYASAYRTFIDHRADVAFRT